MWVSQKREPRAERRAYGFSWRHLLRGRRPGRLAARASLAWGFAAADGERLERRPGPDDLRSREVHTGGLSARNVWQAALRGRAGSAGALRGARRREARAGVWRSQAGDDSRADRGESVPRLPRRFALRARGQGHGLTCCGGLLLQERQRVPGEDQARRVRRGRGPEL